LDKDIPKRKTIRADILRRAQLAEKKVRDKLKVCLRQITFYLLSPFAQGLASKISFTFDAWTSEPGDPYLSITAHYIDAPPDRPMDWELKTDQLAFKYIEGRHTGKNMSTILIDTVDQYDIRGKVSDDFNCLPKLKQFSRLDGLLVMVLLSMAQLFGNLKSSSMKEMMGGQQKNMTYCTSQIHDMIISIYHLS
jgi:hypothetical protein